MSSPCEFLVFFKVGILTKVYVKGEFAAEGTDYAAKVRSVSDYVRGILTNMNDYLG